MKGPPTTQPPALTAIPIDHIVLALNPDDQDARQRVEKRLAALADQGQARRSRVLPDRWLAAASDPTPTDPNGTRVPTETTGTPAD
jgi:hypothetical protein